MTDLNALAERVEGGETSDELWRAISAACDMQTPHGNPMLSLDTAMTLVPQIHFWSLTMQGIARGGFSACCQREGNDLVWHIAPTSAAALTAACLRARAGI